MANFKPLNNYSLFLLDKFIKQYNLKPPFLDVACGNGYLSKHLARKGWGGIAIDYYSKALNEAKKILKEYKKIKVQKKSFSKTTGRYNTVLMFDILEHIKDDISALKKANLLLLKGGFLVIAGPSNPKEWRWDDEFYGHYRRYTEVKLKKKLLKTGFNPIVCYDYTFPIFWLLRIVYTKLIDKKKNSEGIEKRTKKSSLVYAWYIPLLSNILDNTSALWLPLYLTQYYLFKRYTHIGNAMIILAKKK